MIEPLAGRQVRPGIVRLAWPVFAEMSLQTITQVVDLVMVGRLGAVAVAAVGLSFQPLWLATGVFMGLAAGTTAVVARSVGAGDPGPAGRAAHQSFLLAVALALLVGSAVLAGAATLLRLMGAEPAVVAAGSSYVRLLVPGMVALMCGQVVTGALRGAGDTRTPLKISALVNLLNIGGNWVLIFGHLGFPALGLAGAAVATSLARAGGLVLLLAACFRSNAAVPFPRRGFFRPEPATMARVVRVGLPAALERITNSLGMVLYARVVAGLGTVAFAAHAIALNVESLSYMPGIALSVAASALVGQELGARRPDRAIACGWECLRLALTVMGGMGLIFLLLPGPLVRLYTADPGIVTLGVIALRVVAFAQIPEATGFVLGGALRGAGDTLTVLRITLIGVWGVRLISAYLFVPVLGLGILGAWLAMSLDWLVRAAYLAAHFRAGRWREIEV
ncbi:MAG: MATE family efflux transporter [bacterium]|nr:MATE family efflux transporter [bacterium]